MPNCFQLIDKETGKPAILRDVDNRLWEEVGIQKADPEKWYLNWYNTIGLSLACGNNWDRIREIYQESIELCPECGTVIDFLEAHYDSSSWWEGK
jgi:hypothetical protein